MTEESVVSGRVERRSGSKWWYGVYTVDGKRYAKNLRVEVRGEPPGETEEYGSVQFEKSKSSAESELRSLLRSINSDKTAEEIAQAVHQARTGGRKVKAYHLGDLPKLWKNMPRSKPVSGTHRQISLSWINDFVSYAAEHWPNVTKLDHLSPEHAHRYMRFQEKRGISPRTWNAILGTLKTACHRGKCAAFDELRQKRSATVHRVPYSPEELKAIFDAARSDQLLYPLVVTAACTAMRRGDCCRLRWEDVDLKEGFITVKTSKTGRSVDIPVSDLLREVINANLGNGSEYVFPDLADQYERNPKMLTERLRKILAKIGYYEDEPEQAMKVDDYEPAELLQRAEKHFTSIPTKQKREKAQAMFNAYLEGMSLCKAAYFVGISKSTASAYLNEIEKTTGVAFIRGKKRNVEKSTVPKLGSVHAEREQGVRKASLRDFHSFRTTWITLALCSGIPFELVQQVTGHATAEIVMEHYFKPQRAQLKQAIQRSMPKMLTTGAVTPVEKAAQLLRAANSKNWKATIGKALEILEATSGRT